jgi:hypothetical protein
MKSFTTAIEEAVREGEGAEEEVFTEFEIDGRTLRAYPPTDGQLAFILASMGRGQTTDQRFAAIVNLMLESLRDADKDYLESRLLSRNPKTRIPIQMVEEIFVYLMEQWFARPTQPQSGSAPSPQSDGQN